MHLFDPELGALLGRATYRATLFPDQPVANQSTELGMLQHDVRLSGPLWQGPSDEWSGSLSVRNQEFSTGARLPDTREPFPDELWNVRAGTAYRHRFDSGWIGAFNLLLGSPSDEPFHSVDELDVNATALLRVPARGRDAWIFFLNYANNRELLPGIPLPGLGYAYEPSDRFSAVLTTGLVSLRYRPIEELTLQATYIALRTVDVRLTYQLFRPVRVWTGFDWTSERYLRAHRASSDDRFFYYEKRVRAGVIIGFARRPQMWIDVDGGYSFDRFYFEGEDYGDRDRNRVDVGAGPFVQIRLGARF